MRWSERFGIRGVCYLLLVLFALSSLPLIAIGYYNFPSADDYSMAFEVHETFVATGNPFAVIVSAVRLAADHYMNWVGYYFSDFATALAPSVFGERCYAVVTVIILAVFTFCMLYFFHALLTKRYGVRRHLAGAVAFLVMTMILQCMPAQDGARTEALYWWAGACNYIMMWSLGVLWAGLLVSCTCDTGRKHTWDYLCACVLGLLLGGANYMTGLTLAIISVLCIVLRMMPRKKTEEGMSYKGRIPVFPGLLNLAGFAVACLAPGNQVRGAFGQGFPAAKSIAISLYYTLSYCVGDWTTWPVLTLFLLLFLLLGMAAAESAGDVHDTDDLLTRWPVLTVLLSFGLISANMTPILFTRGDIGSGRMISIIWAQYILLAALAAFYCFRYAARLMREKHFFRQTKRQAHIRDLTGMCALVLTGFLAGGSVLSLMVNPHFYTTSSAVTDLTNGNASRYLEESITRLSVLQGEDSDVVIPAYRTKPELLFFSDITPDETEWINTAMAEYYHKNTVRTDETNR